MVSKRICKWFRKTFCFLFVLSVCQIFFSDDANIRRKMSRVWLVCLLGAIGIGCFFFFWQPAGVEETVGARRVNLNNFALMFAWLLYEERVLRRSALLSLLSRLILATAVSLVLERLEV